MNNSTDAHEILKKFGETGAKSGKYVPYNLILLVILLIVKFCGVNIPWIWVFSPIWIPFAIVAAIVVGIWAIIGVGLLIISALEFFFDK